MGVFFLDCLLGLSFFFVGMKRVTSGCVSSSGFALWIGFCFAGTPQLQIDVTKSTVTTIRGGSRIFEKGGGGQTQYF